MAAAGAKEGAWGPRNGGQSRRRARLESNPVRVTAAAVSPRPALSFPLASRSLCSAWRHRRAGHRVRQAAISRPRAARWRSHVERCMGAARLAWSRAVRWAVQAPHGDKPRGSRPFSITVTSCRAVTKPIFKRCAGFFEFCYCFCFTAKLYACPP